VAAGLALPFTPLAWWFGFSPLPLGFLLILGVMVVVYLALVEAGKTLFFSRTDRLASRWTLPRKAMPGTFGPSWQAERQGHEVPNDSGARRAQTVH
jgi:Mg2+-importing ATPase